MAVGAICGANYLEVGMPMVFCETCGRRRRMLYRMEAWRGGYWRCLSCGENYHSEEDRVERPFARGWRERSVVAAKEFWARNGRKEFRLSDVEGLRSG